MQQIEGQFMPEEIEMEPEVHRTIAGGFNKSLFVQKNQNIAPYYKEYKNEKHKIIRNINFKKQLFAKIRG